MRKHKRWTIGLAIIFLAVCFMVPRLANQRPYKFLAGAKIDDYQANALSAHIQLESDERVADLMVLADAELLHRGWTKRSYHKPPHFVYSLPRPGMRFGDSITLTAGPGRTFVDVMRNATLSDRITAWLYNLKRR